MNDDNSPDLITIDNGAVRVSVALRGAELLGVHFEDREWLWNRDPRWWSSSAPLLFPVIGGCFDGRVSIEGRSVPMEMHGFLHHRIFKIVQRSEDLLTLECTSDPQTTAIYPFTHAVRVTTLLTANGLEMTAEIENQSDGMMPYCFGFHPAFPWPLGPEREDFVCRFSEFEDGEVRKTDASTLLLRPLPVPSPLDGRTLYLRDTLFDRGIQFQDVKSRAVWFGKAGESGIAVTFPDSAQLAVWSKPGAPLLSIEPWQGFPQEAHLDDALEKRHGVRFLESGETARHRLGLAFDVPDPGA